MKNKSKPKCNHTIKIPGVKTSLEGNVLTLDYDAYSCDSSFTVKLEINYCHMCGEKLEEIKQ